MNINWKNVIERAAWTFIEGFLGSITFGVDMDKTMIISGAMAGLSCLKTLILEIARDKNASY